MFPELSTTKILDSSGMRKKVFYTHVTSEYSFVPEKTEPSQGRDEVKQSLLLALRKNTYQCIYFHTHCLCWGEVKYMFHSAFGSLNPLKCRWVYKNLWKWTWVPANSAVLLCLPEEKPRWKPEPDYDAILLWFGFSSWHVVTSGLAILIPSAVYPLSHSKASTLSTEKECISGFI